MMTEDSVRRLGHLVEHARELRERYQADPHRPRYHFLAPEGICYPFDPQGCIYWRGRYHLFYAVQAEEVGLWGHASSTDLLHWRHHPIPLGIGPGDPEEQVYAGGALITREGMPAMIYHGVNAGTCIATSDDAGLLRWRKHPANPVLRVPGAGDPGHGRYHVWDTCGWVHGDAYYSISGNKPDTPPRTEGDVAYLFRSSDLAHWEYLHPFYVSERRWTDADEDCSCPDFFPLGDRHVLMFISHTRGTQYYVGHYTGERFHPERHGRLNWAGGPSFAQESLLDGSGRRIFWAWLCESRTRDAQLRAGWAGVMSLPRELSLASDGTLGIAPAAELRRLRLNPRRYDGVRVAAGACLPLEVRGDCLELALEVGPGEADSEFGVLVRRSPDGAEQTEIAFDPAAQVLRIDTSRSSLSSEVVQPWPQPSASFLPDPLAGRADVRVQEAPFALRPGESLELRIFLDRSVLEVFANGRQCMAQRIYPTRGDSTGIALLGRGRAVTVRSLRTWDLAATNPW